MNEEEATAYDAVSTITITHYKSDIDSMFTVRKAGISEVSIFDNEPDAVYYAAQLLTGEIDATEKEEDFPDIFSAIKKQNEQEGCGGQGFSGGEGNTGNSS